VAILFCHCEQSEAIPTVLVIQANHIHTGFWIFFGIIYACQVVKIRQKPLSIMFTFYKV